MNKPESSLDQLHAAILNLPTRAMPDGLSVTPRTWYKLGHRDARHAAAELVLAASPQAVPLLPEQPQALESHPTSASGGDASKTALPEEEPDYTCRSCNGTGDGGIPRGPGYSFPCRACGGTGTEPKGQS